MPRFRRTRFLAFLCEDGELLDPNVDSAGLDPSRSGQFFACSALTGEEMPLTPEELLVLTSVPSEKTIDEADLPVSSELLGELAHLGLLVSDEDDPSLLELRRRDKVLDENHWDPLSAVYHFTTRWRDRGIGGDSRVYDETFEEFLHREGLPPSHFHTMPEAGPRIDLPLERPDEPFFRLLGRRRTTRVFDDAAPTSLVKLAAVLFYSFGCQGYVRHADGVVTLKKTSPSGGAMHPTEAYPIIADVEGARAGIYHYNVEHHALQLLEPLTRDQAQTAIREFTVGQDWFAGAHAVVVLAPRFGRAFWKYHNDRAYAAVLLDVAHLSATFYLVCAALGLGAFVTAALNRANVDERLGLDPYSEGSVAICGCGLQARTNGEPRRYGPYIIERQPTPYIPRETIIE